MKMLTIILALLIPQMVMARIGETKEQCDKRYGEAAAINIAGVPAGYSYKKGAFKVTADFMGGVCHVIRYARIDGDKIKQSTLSHLLGVNADKWEPGSLDARYTYFVSHVEGIGAVKARYDNINYSLFLATMAFAESKGKKLTDDVRAKDTDGL